MTYKLLALCLLAVACIGCSQRADQVEITEIRTTTSEERDAMPLLGAAARMGIDSGEGASPQSPHGDIPPPMLAEPPAMSDIGAPPDPSLLHWQTPDNWIRGDERPMRLATYYPEGAEQTECAVTVLSGTAGGIPANMNRWRTQLGLPPLTESEMAALPRWEMLGAEATYIRCADSADEVTLYGVICPIPGGLLFVKMTGPTDEMTPERERFKEFCLSMEMKEEM